MLAVAIEIMKRYADMQKDKEDDDDGDENPEVLNQNSPVREMLSESISEE